MVLSTRFTAFLGTVLLVVGAFSFGNAIHQSVVTGTVPVTAPATVIPAVIGTAFMLVGYRLYRPATEYLDVPSDEDDPGSGAESDDGPEVSPIADADLDHLEADDEKR